MLFNEATGRKVPIPATSELAGDELDRRDAAFWKCCRSCSALFQVWSCPSKHAGRAAVGQACGRRLGSQVREEHQGKVAGGCVRPVMANPARSRAFLYRSGSATALKSAVTPMNGMGHSPGPVRMTSAWVTEKAAVGAAGRAPPRRQAYPCPRCSSRHEACRRHRSWLSANNQLTASALP